MKRLLITGADGFVGRWLLRGAPLIADEVIAAISPEGIDPRPFLDSAEAARTTIVRGDLRDRATINEVVRAPLDAVIHLAAVASGPAVRRDPTLGWAVNAGVTAELADACAAQGSPTFLLVSTGEVYGRGHTDPISEFSPLAPISPYAATKVGAEQAALEVWRRTGLPVVIARPFPHTGPGQSEHFVFPALAARLLAAKRNGVGTVSVGNLEPVRDLLDVRDVVTAYLGLVERGVPGEAYNIASGIGVKLSEAFAQLARIIGVKAEPVPDPSLMRQADLPVLIGNAHKLRRLTNWGPAITIERTFQDLVDAQAH